VDDDDEPISHWDASGKDEWRRDEVSDMAKRQQTLGATDDAVTRRRRAPREKGPPPPMTVRDTLRMAARIADALKDLDVEQQRGVVGIAGITGPDHAFALGRVLRILAGCSTMAERAAVVATAAACLGGGTMVAAREPYLDEPTTGEVAP